MISLSPQTNLSIIEHALSDDSNGRQRSNIIYKGFLNLAESEEGAPSHINVEINVTIPSFLSTGIVSHDLDTLSVNNRNEFYTRVPLNVKLKSRISLDLSWLTFFLQLINSSFVVYFVITSTRSNVRHEERTTAGVEVIRGVSLVITGYVVSIISNIGRIGELFHGSLSTCHTTSLPPDDSINGSLSWTNSDSNLSQRAHLYTDTLPIVLDIDDAQSYPTSKVSSDPDVANDSTVNNACDVDIMQIDFKLREARKILHDTLPFITTRLSQSAQKLSSFEFNIGRGSISYGATNKFKFDGIHDENTSQDEVFTKLSDKTSMAMSGMPFIFIAIGASGSGKHLPLPDGDFGLVGRSLESCLGKIGSSDILTLSAVEIGPSTVTDLLNRRSITLTDGIFDGKSESKIIKRMADIYSAIRTIDANRTTSSTDSNGKSSRTHMIIRITIKMPGTPGNNHMVFVDLAGYEPLNSCDAGSTKFINSSSTSLQGVLMSMTQFNSILSYRNSQLTRILRPYLSTKCKIILFATLRVSSLTLRGNLNTLRSVSMFTGVKRRYGY